MIEILWPFNVNFFKHDYPNSNYKTMSEKMSGKKKKKIPDHVSYCARDLASANTKNINWYVNKCDHSMG